MVPSLAQGNPPLNPPSIGRTTPSVDSPVCYVERDYGLEPNHRVLHRVPKRPRSHWDGYHLFNYARLHFAGGYGKGCSWRSFSITVGLGRERVVLTIRIKSRANSRIRAS